MNVSKLHRFGAELIWLHPATERNRASVGQAQIGGIALLARDVAIEMKWTRHQLAPAMPGPRLKVSTAFSSVCRRLDR
jgi:hypothetical protein